MKFFIGVTDNDWYRFLASIHPDEVNFWQPSGKHPFARLNPGDLFLFKMHAPDRRIAGGGFFVSHSEFPLSLAWDAFGEKNGVPDYPTFLAKIRAKRVMEEIFPPETQIGCIVLRDPFFFPEHDWLPQPEKWGRGIQTGKTYDTSDFIGRRLYKEILERLARLNAIPIDEIAQAVQVHDQRERYGAERNIRPRLGQGTFRLLVTDAYERRCAITGERTLPVLEAAHIKPFNLEGPNEVQNGLLLRDDLHKLFDHGLLTVTTDYRVKISRRIRDTWGNGRIYYELDDRPVLVLPGKECEQPAKEFLEWHNQKVFVS